MQITIDTPKMPYQPYSWCAIGLVILSVLGYYGYNYWHEHNKPDFNKPDIVLNKESYDIGDTVIAQIKHKSTNYNSVSIAWSVFDGEFDKTDFKEYPNEIIFGTGKETKCFRIVASVSYSGSTGIANYVVTTLVKINVAPQPPPVPPDPPKPAVPTFPNEKLGLSTFSYNSFIKNVDASVRAKLAVAFANNFSSFSAAIAAGTKKDSETALKELNEANNKVLSNNNIQRIIVVQFFNELQAQLSAIDDKIGLERLDNLKQCLDEVAVGLQNIK